MSKLFKGKKVFNDNGYPAIYYPSHPLARKNGSVRIHRLIVYETYKLNNANFHVHHKDGNRGNYKKGNLVLTNNSDHIKEHKKQYQSTKYCSYCKKAIATGDKRRLNRKNIYCNKICYSNDKNKIKWPKDDKLLKLVIKNGYEQVGRNLGVSGTAVKKRLKIKGL